MECRDPQRHSAAVPRVSTFIVRALIEVVERAGVTREKVMAAAQLDVARLDDILGGFSFPGSLSFLGPYVTSCASLRAGCAVCGLDNPRRASASDKERRAGGFPLPE